MRSHNAIMPLLLLLPCTLAGTPHAMWSGTNNYYGTSQSRVGPPSDLKLSWSNQTSQAPTGVCPSGGCAACGPVAPVALSDRVIGVWKSQLKHAFVVYAVSYKDTGELLWQTEFEYTADSSAGVPNSIAVSENGIIAVLYTKDFHQGAPLPNRNITYALVDSKDGSVVHSDTFGKQTGFTVPIAGPIVDPERGNVFYFASGGFYERFDNGSRVVPWDGTYGFSRPDYTLQPFLSDSKNASNMVVAVGAVGSGYGGTIETTTTETGADGWHVFDTSQRSYSQSSFTDPSFSSLYYSVATSASGSSYKGSFVSRDMKTGNKRWEWAAPSMREMLMVNGGVRFLNTTTTTTNSTTPSAASANGGGGGGGGGGMETGHEQFAPLAVWKSGSGNVTLTLIDDATGDSVWDFATPWASCSRPKTVVTTNKDATSSLADTKIVFTCQGYRSPGVVASYVVDPSTGRELPAQSAKIPAYTTNLVCDATAAGRNTVFRYGTNGEIVYARLD